jgi:hypothetical protein
MKYINLIVFSEVNDVNRSIQYAEQIRTTGNLIIIAMGTNVNVTLLQTLSMNTFAYRNYSAPPSTLTQQIVDAISC